MASRLIADLDKPTQVKFLAFAGKMAEAGIPFMLTCTYRSQDEQDKDIWPVGRTIFKNPCRCGGKINQQGECPKHPFGLCITWVNKSKHSERRAFDIAILKNSKPTWDLKVSVDGDDIPDYLEAAEIGRIVGLKAGADFKDYPHFENRE